MVNIFRYLFLIALPLSGWSQHVTGNTTNSGTGVNMVDHMLIMDSRKGSSESETYIEGTPYAKDEFMPAFVRVQKGTFDDLPARYNAYDDNLEYQLKGVTYVITPSPSIMLVKFSDYSLVVDILTSRNNSYAFFIRLDSGRATLLSRKPIQFKEAEAPKAIQVEGKPPRYVERQQEFYIKLTDEPPKQFANAKKLIDILPDHRSELEAFVSANKIGKNAEDLARLIAYYNSL